MVRGTQGKSQRETRNMHYEHIMKGPTTWDGTPYFQFEVDENIHGIWNIPKFFKLA